MWSVHSRKPSLRRAATAQRRNVDPSIERFWPGAPGIEVRRSLLWRRMAESMAGHFGLALCFILGKDQVQWAITEISVSYREFSACCMPGASKTTGKQLWLGLLGVAGLRRQTCHYVRPTSRESAIPSSIDYLISSTFKSFPLILVHTSPTSALLLLPSPSLSLGCRDHKPIAPWPRQSLLPP